MLQVKKKLPNYSSLIKVLTFLIIFYKGRKACRRALFGIFPDNRDPLEITASTCWQDRGIDKICYNFELCFLIGSLVSQCTIKSLFTPSSWPCRLWCLCCQTRASSNIIFQPKSENGTNIIVHRKTAQTSKCSKC